MSIFPKRLASVGSTVVVGCVSSFLFVGCVNTRRSSECLDPASRVASITSRIEQHELPSIQSPILGSSTDSQPFKAERVDGAIRQVGFAKVRSEAVPSEEIETEAKMPQTSPKIVTIDGVTYALKPINNVDQPQQLIRTASMENVVVPAPLHGEQGLVGTATAEISSESGVKRFGEAPVIEGAFELPMSAAIENPIPLNLPSVLAAIDGQHPIVGLARWRVQSAYARNDQANLLWLPSIQAGFSFHRHDGNYQASNGDIVDVNRNSFQYGLGAGATGAGTTNPRPGIVAQFHLADAIFLPRVTKKAAWAQGHSANATLNEQLLTAAQAYFTLVDAHQDLRIVEEARKRIADVAAITVDFAEAGEGLQADADRLRTELVLIDSRLLGAEERVAVAAAQLAQAISLEGGGGIVPTDVNAVPLELTTPQVEQASLVATALVTRPELKESQALVAAACEAFQREKYAPFVPSVLLGFSTGGFGGGLGNNLDNVDSRYDFDALLTWEVRNLGLGEKAIRREQAARVQQARFEKLRVMDQIAREVREAHSQVEFRSRQIQIASGAIENAEASYRRNLERIRDGEGLPLEVLQSAQASESAQRAYLRAVVDYNQAQIRLQWALGFPVDQ